MSDFTALIEQFGAWAFVAIIAGFLLKYVIMDLRKDNERNYAMAGKLHKRFDEIEDIVSGIMSELNYLQGKLNGRKDGK